MKTIYKSIALEAALLSVTLALQAEIQSEGETVTADVQANTLDRLKVTLVSPNVSGARDLVASGNATIEGNEIAVNLENLAFGTHRLVVSARFGTQIRTLYALDISVPQAELPNETQEYEDAAIVVSTYGDGGGGGEFPTDYAKQGDDPTATLTDTQAYAQAAAEAAQSLTSLDSDINAGKTAIAQAVTAKGVPTSPTDTMLQMATNVTQIAQAPISINGGEMYAKQLYGSLTTPNYWNLYEVMAQLLSDGRLNNYGGILLAEYHKGYDSLLVQNADAFVFSDVDANGNFELYDESISTTHVWRDDKNGKGNRWVAYCFIAAESNFAITDTDTCPRTIHIGRHMGVISSSVNGRISEIVCVEDGILNSLYLNDHKMNWNKRVVLRLREHTINSSILKGNGENIESIYIEIGNYAGTTSSVINTVNASIVYKGTGNLAGAMFVYGCNAPYINISGVNDMSMGFTQSSVVGVFELRASRLHLLSPNAAIKSASSIKRVYLYVDEIALSLFQDSTAASCEYLFIGYDEEDTTKSAILGTAPSSYPVLSCELQQGYRKNLDISGLNSGWTAEMIALQLLNKLGVNEVGSELMLKIGSANLATIQNDSTYSSYLTDAVDNKHWNVEA